MLSLTNTEKTTSKIAFIGIIKSLLAPIPIVGPCISVIDEYNNARLEELVEQLTLRIGIIEENKIDKTYVESEEFYDLLRRAIQIRLQSRSKIKAEFIYKMITESITIDRDQQFTTALKETFLVFIEKLSEEAIIFLYEFSNGKYEKQSIPDIYQIGETQGISMDELFSNNLIRNDSSWNQNLAMTKLGNKFVKYLQEIILEKDFAFNT